jgi:signal transduction histidine kinase
MRWLLALIALPQADFALTPASISGPTGFVSLHHAWRYHPGDDPAWAAPDFDDSSWQRSRTSLELDQGPPEGWDGIGWYRTTIDVAPELTGVPVAFWLRILGAAEIYLDGRLIDRRGAIDEGRARQPEPYVVDPRTPQIITFDRPGRHSIAIRYATETGEYEPYLSFFRGVEVSLGDYLRSVEHRSRFNIEYHGIHKLFIGAALVLAVLHMLIFLFTRAYPENFYFALATIFVSGIAGFSRHWSFSETADQAILPTTMFKISLISSVVFSIAYYHQVYYDRLTRGFWLLVTAGVVLAAGAYWIPIRFVFLLASLAFVEPLRMLAKMLMRKMEDAWIIAIGGTVSTVSALAQMLPMILGDDDPNAPMPIYLYGFLVLLLSMSIYLARRFARMNVRLRDQLAQVQELSQLTLTQERENARKQIELEEAKKREAVLAELQAAHEDLKRTQAKLVQSEKMASLGQLVAGVAHEINTPVGAIHSVRDSLAKAVEKMKAELSKQQPELLEEPAVKRSLTVLNDGLRVIETGSSRVTSIVKRLKTFARLDEAELQLADLHAGIEDTLVLIQHELKKGIEVERDFGEIPKISCYPGALNQVFLNLLVNAAQAIADKGKITIQTRAEGSHVVLRFTDTGSGIAPEIVKRIFDPGFTTKGVGVGTGLGLSICYRIVSEHHGEISVESEAGRGSTFTVRLPIER